MRTPRDRRWTAVVLSASVALSGCASIPSSLQSGRLKDELGNISSRRYVRVRGIAVAPTGVSDKTARRTASRQAALALARKELLGILGRLRITGRILVGDAMVIDQRLKESVDSLVASAEEVKIEWGLRDECVVVLQILRRDVDKIKSGISFKDLPKPLSEEMRRFWKRGGKRERKTQRRAGSRGGFTSDTALLYGLLWPGAGQMVAARHVRNPDLARSLRTRGWVTMGVTLGLVGLGVGLLTEEPETTQKDLRTREETKTNPKPAGYAILGVGALLMLWGAWDGKKTLERNGFSVGVSPDGRGARVEFAKRF